MEEGVTVIWRGAMVTLWTRRSPFRARLFFLSVGSGAAPGEMVSVTGTVMTSVIMSV